MFPERELLHKNFSGSFLQRWYSDDVLLHRVVLFQLICIQCDNIERWTFLRWFEDSNWHSFIYGLFLTETFQGNIYYIFHD